MGAFPEDYEIKASRLVRLWVAEGFLKANGEKSLEEEAEDYLKALVERNLVLVGEKKGNGKPKSYNMHDLLRDLCIQKADEEKFLHVKNGRVEKVTSSKLRCVSVHTSYRMQEVFASVVSMSLARSFLCTGPMSCEILSPLTFALRLLRVLDVMEMSFHQFPTEMLQLVNLRYLAFSSISGLPYGISRLLNLQTLITRFEWGPVPSEIWEMSELRHLTLSRVIYIEEGSYNTKFVGKKLLTISLVRITPSLISCGFFESIPNINNLGIYCDILPSSAVDLTHIHKLQTLRCHSRLKNAFYKDGCRFLPTLRFPCNLRKLSFLGCVIFGRVMTTLCALQNLEVLRIESCVFESEARDEEWDAAEGDEFGSLQFLRLSDLNLVRWRADETNFPSLRHLFIDFCDELEEIPTGIGEIPTLQLIQLRYCSPVVASAKHIQKVQQSDYENYDLQLSIIRNFVKR